ncbi:MAG: hypothetical protein B6D46_04835 [Polyangiaceae bacterium UTPRO1]|jgi:hypothetical protein|nr:hypothetical protein [Myxococcales bacterium]OQY68004.1 MAG: hypothetical protein B6D46_04835 [Polyangiaceae bacterium UTPRO1]
MARKTHRPSPPAAIRLVILTVALASLPHLADAQIFKVCGDVDANGVVSVTDGVQVLRAAAGLTSDCTDAICDIDVSGAVTVTDGVVVLRKAAGLAITENCIPHDGKIDSQLAYLLRFGEPLVSAVLPTIVLRRSETVDNSFECQNGEDGLYEVSYFDGQQDGAFSDCYFDNAVINGDAENSGDDPVLSIEIADARNDDTLAFEGTNGTGLLGVSVEGGVKYSGRLDGSAAFARFDTADFLLVVSNLQVGTGPFPLGGSISYEFDADSEMPGIRRARVYYDGSNLARVEVTFSDGSFKYYRFELRYLNFL